MHLNLNLNWQNFLQYLLISTSLLLSQASHAQVYKCVDDTGGVTYTNAKTATGKCVALRLPVDPPPPTVIHKSAPKQVSIYNTSVGRASGNNANNAANNNFPKVSSEQQKGKDLDRLRILEKELATEQKSLLEAKNELEKQQAVRNGDERNYQKYLDRVNGYQEQVSKHERNIKDLSSEIGKLRSN